MAFTKTGAPETGVRVADGVKPIDAVDTPEAREIAKEEPERKEEVEEDVVDEG